MNALYLLRQLDRLVAAMLRWIVILGLALLFLLVGWGIVARAFTMSFAARDEIIELVMIWTVLAGMLALWREDRLYRVEVVIDNFTTLAAWLRPLIELCKLAFAAVLVWKGWEFAFSLREVTPFLGFDKAAIYGAIPVSGLIACLYSVAGLAASLWALRPARPAEPRPGTGR